MQLLNSFRLGSSATSGYVLTTDATGKGTWQASTSGGTSGALSAVNIPFTDGDTSRRVTISDSNVTSSSAVVGSIRRPDTADDSADYGYLYTVNVVKVSSGSFDVLVTALDTGGGEPLTPPNETVQFVYNIAVGTSFTPRARIYRSAAFNLANGAWTKFPLDAIENGLDNDLMFDAANARLVCKTAGSYQLSGQVCFANNTTGANRLIAIAVNGIAHVENSASSAGSQSPRAQASGTWDLAVGDYVELFAYQDTGAVMAMSLTDASFPGTPASNLNWLAAVKVGPTNAVNADQIYSSLPSNPVDGQTISYLADGTNGVVWRLRYRSASASTYKWECIGGSPLFAEVTTATTIPSNQTVYGNLTSGSGPDITVPLAGDYMIEHGVDATAPNGTSVHAYMSFAIGATAAVDADAVLWANISAASPQATFNAARKHRKTGLTAATTLASKYRVDAAVAVNIQDRWMSAVPVRVG